MSAENADHVLPEAPISSAVMDRAVQVAGLLATAGHHQGLSLSLHSAVGPERTGKRRSELQAVRACQADGAVAGGGCAGRRSLYPRPILSAFRIYDHFMARWLTTRSGVGRLVTQVVILAVAVGAVYLLVLMLGSGL